MKQLLQHYKEVKEKANPDNWTRTEVVRELNPLQQALNNFQDRNIYYEWRIDIDPNDTFTEDNDFEIGKYDVQDNFSKYQKEQLEIEALLYWHWDFTVDQSTYGEMMSHKKSRGVLFNEWLEEQLKDL